MPHSAENKSTVGIVKIRELRNRSETKDAFFDILNVMKQKGKIQIPPEAKIFIKPNICCVKGYETGATVDPLLVKYLIEWLKKNFNIKMITVGEADATQMKADIAFRVLGWYDLLSPILGVQFVNLSKDKKITVELDGLYYRKLEMSETYMESDFLISFGKLKIHYPVGISCVLKNQFGANPVKYKAQFHKHLSEVIYDLNKVKIPNFCVVDGIIGMEGYGPTSGVPKPLGVILVGDDPVSVDYACAEIMGINPKRIEYLKLAKKRKLGNAKYDIIGEGMDTVKTKFKFGPSRTKKVLTFIQNKIPPLLKR